MTRSFGADDHPVCVKCGSPTSLMRRGPDPDHGFHYQRQGFECTACNTQIERRADRAGYDDPMRRSAVQGWLKGELVAPK